ncbi:flagellar basal body P-ring protein FlgI [Pigmentiphaga aceris]|uniref:Flagellar P-ring protein n=1 Tax=Pigmentiphaga aceris TaxID=1940612 RepID=A0A5C0AYF2_9BURK|nr:flagellar basal body P-ring protein FlgI [Pigmentiphaga aceris]QEI07215.1 flagellar basal body P-ring protein FlgI [Pigmentiphaga aceris]
MSTLVSLAPRNLALRLRTLLGCALAGVALVTAVAPAHAARIKDIASLQGVRNNQVVGYGLVVGLDGTGDQTTQTPFTTQSLMAMLSQLGVNVPPGTRLQLKNVAAVMVTATLPPFAQPGQTLDITVSSMGNAKSLRGGTLVLTPLKGADGQVYALAQGNLAVGGAGASAGGSKAQINHLSAGRVPNGATVEREVPTAFGDDHPLRLELLQADFSTAKSVVDTVNRRFGQNIARALDSRVIEVIAPPGPDGRVEFMASIEELEVTRGRVAAKVVVNARTGSVVMNQSVRLNPVAVAHGNLTVTVNNAPEVSQPNAFSNGETVVVPRTDIQVTQQGGALIQLDGGAQLSEVVKALNMLGASPADLISILQALQSSGALTAELEVI